MTPWVQCSKCGKVVKINKPLLGSLHLCIDEFEELRLKEMRQAYEAQMRIVRPEKGNK